MIRLFLFIFVRSQIYKVFRVLLIIQYHLGLIVYFANFDCFCRICLFLVCFWFVLFLVFFSRCCFTWFCIVVTVFVCLSHCNFYRLLKEFMYYSEEMIASGRIKFIIKGIVLLALGTQIILLVYQPYRQHRQHRIPNASINERYRCVTHDIERANIVTSIDGKFFLFSAIFVNISDEALNTYQCKQGISVQLWEYNVPKEENAFCCYVLQNSSEYCDEVQHRIVDYAFDIPLHSAHYICRTSEPESNIRSLTIISNATLRKKKKVNSLFHKQYRENYISISPSLIGHKEGLAICSQITYRDTKAATLIEWFEAQKLLGVDKIMTHSYNLNSDAMRVLEYYEQEGFLVLIRGFAFPLKGN